MAHAGPVVYIEPDNVGDEWDMTRAFYGTTLSVSPQPWCEGAVFPSFVVGKRSTEGYPGGIIDDGTDATDQNIPAVATTGKRVMAVYPCDDGLSWYSSLGPEEIVATFNKLGVDFIFDNTDPTSQPSSGAVLNAYDACGKLIQSVAVSADMRGPMSNKTAGVYNDKKALIAKVTLGGAPGTWTQVDNVQAHLSTKKPVCRR